jgi:hypothetical protein
VPADSAMRPSCPPGVKAGQTDGGQSHLNIEPGIPCDPGHQ